jgi:hypothetical protein
MAALSLLLGAGSAAASTEELRPVSDLVRGWTPVHARAAWAAIDDRVTAGERVPPADRIKAKSGRRTTVVNLDNPVVPEGEVPTGLTAHFFARTGKRTHLDIKLLSGRQSISRGSLTPGTQAGWYKMDTSGIDQIDLTNLRLTFRASHKRRTEVRAAYVKLVTTPQGDPDPVPEPASGEVSVFGSTTTIRPDQATPAGGTTSAKLIAARNEFESFQVVIAPNDTLQGARLELAGALTGPSGATIDPGNITIYREEYYEVSAEDGKPRSSRTGGEGRWADALIPERDPYYGEDRAAFPVDIAAGDKLIAWVDVFVPADAVPGSYTGELRVADSNGDVAKVPIKVQVSNFAMPSTTTLSSAFLMTPPGYFPCKAHRPADWCHPEEEENWKLDYLYARAALENRITIPNAMPGAYGQAPTSPHFEEYVLPLINGSDDGGIDGTLAPRLSGAKMTSVTAMYQCVVADSCLAQWRTLAQKHGFGDRFFAYVCDEPVTGETPQYWSDWGDCARNSRRAKQIWPGVKTMVTSWIQNARDAERDGTIEVNRDIDLLSSPVQYMANRPDNPQAGDQTSAYSSFLAQPGKESWLYTACPQHSCDERESPYFDGWPAYAIDQPASQARAMGWISFLYGSDGELFHNTTLKLDTAWENQYQNGGNGNGTLFYPGSPEGYGSAPAIGGEHDIPIESIRMKRIREGREDYELLYALSASGNHSTASEAVTSLLGSRDTAMFSTDVSQGQIDTLRCVAMSALDASVDSACAA